MRVLIAGGGTAGHVEPALTLADELRARDGANVVEAVGTASGLEAALVPSRGYELHLIPAVPLPRRPTPALLKVPGRLRTAMRACSRAIRELDADVVVGFGGYVSVPAYLAARRARVPIVVHEGNARAGIANRLGARLTPWRAVNVPGALPGAEHVGMPLRPAIANLDREALSAAARAHFGLAADRPVLLVFGGSLGAQRINAAVRDALPHFLDEGFAVLHAVGARNIGDALPPVPGCYVPLAYIDRMDFAYAAADLAVCRAGAMTCAELAAVGLPALLVPLAVGNGEQSLNADPLARAGAAAVIDDAQFDGSRLIDAVIPVLSDASRRAVMGTAAHALGIRDGAARLADMVERAARGDRR